MRISHKLRWIVIIAIATLVVFAAFGVYFYQRNVQLTNNLVGAVIPSIELSARFGDQLKRSQLLVLSVVGGSSIFHESDEAQLRQLVGDLPETLAAQRKFADTSAQRGLLSQARDSLALYLASVNKALQLKKSGEPIQALAIFEGVASQYQRELDGILATLAIERERSKNKKLQALERARESTFRILLGVALLAIPGLFTLLVLVQRKINARISHVVDASTTIARGGIHRPVPLHERFDDELTEALAAIENMRQSLEKQFRDIEAQRDAMADQTQALERATAELEARNEELLLAKGAAESASRAKSDFLASMSHELRTPLNSILGFAQLLGTDDALPKEVKESVEEIERAGRHLLALVNDLIDLARIESNKLELSMEPTPVLSLLHSAVAMAKPLASERGVHLEEEQCKCNLERAYIQADPLRLKQIIVNLVSNAIKYNRPGGMVQVVCSLADTRIRIRVIDNGPGIPAEKQARLFTAFDRLGYEAGQIAGTGIGLLISKRLVDFMGGQIGFESTEGKGTTFWIELPASIQNELESTQKPMVCETTPDAFDTSVAKQVLYVEDNSANMRLMRKMLGRSPHIDLLEAADAERGIALARDALPDLVLMDINLPGMDGYAALAALRADPLTAGIPVVAVTAHAMKGDLSRGDAMGFDDYLTKPIEMAKLFAVVERYLGRDHAPDGKDKAASTSASRAAELPELAGIDTKVALQRLQGDVEMYLDILFAFHDRQQGFGDEMRTLLGDPGRREAAERLAHTLKGLAGTIGAEALAESSRKLEKMIRDGTAIDACLAESESTKTQLDEVLRAIEKLEHMRPAQAEANGVSDGKALANILATLKEQLETFNPEAGESAARLSAALAGTDKSAQAERVRELATRYDFEAAREELSLLEERLHDEYDGALS